jgi:hypothetical protein
LFEDIFSAIQKKNPEIKCIGVWGKDGLELERSTFSDCSMNLELIGAQFADIISKFEGLPISSQRSHIRLDYGDHYLAVYSLTEDYFMVILAEPDILPGRLNFFVNLRRDDLTAIL